MSVSNKYLSHPWKSTSMLMMLYRIKGKNRKEKCLRLRRATNYRTEMWWKKILLAKFISSFVQQLRQTSRGKETKIFLHLVYASYIRVFFHGIVNICMMCIYGDVDQNGEPFISQQSWSESRLNHLKLNHFTWTAFDQSLIGFMTWCLHSCIRTYFHIFRLFYH